MTQLSLQEKIIAGVVTEKDFDGMERDEIVRQKSMAGVAFRAQPRAVAKAAIDVENMIVPYFASTEVIDRTRDIIRIGKNRKTGGTGFDHANYDALAAPFFMSHMSSDFPIGNVIKTEKVTRRVKASHVEEGAKKSATVEVPALRQTVKYVEDAGEWRFGTLAFEFVTRGVMNAVSVGIRFKQVQPLDEEEFARMGFAWGGLDIQGSEQLELSQAPVPANQLAHLDDGSAIAKSIDSCLDQLAHEGKLSKRLLKDFRVSVPFGPIETAKKLRDKVRSFVDFGAANVTPEQTELRMILDEQDRLFMEKVKERRADIEKQEAAEKAQGEKAEAKEKAKHGQFAELERGFAASMQGVSLKGSSGPSLADCAAKGEGQASEAVLPSVPADLNLGGSIEPAIDFSTSEPEAVATFSRSAFAEGVKLILDQHNKTTAAILSTIKDVDLEEREEEKAEEPAPPELTWEIVREWVEGQDLKSELVGMDRGHAEVVLEVLDHVCGKRKPYKRPKDDDGGDTDRALAVPEELEQQLDRGYQMMVEGSEVLASFLDAVNETREKGVAHPRESRYTILTALERVIALAESNSADGGSGSGSSKDAAKPTTPSPEDEEEIDEKDAERLVTTIRGFAGLLS